jgi:deoxyribonuclease-4
MADLLFGTGGNPHSAETSSTIDGIRRIAELGLGCMEMEFVYRVTMGEKTAQEVVKETANKGINLSAHASYYINLNARELEKRKASQQRLLQAARIASICGAKSVVFHTAFYLGDPPEKAYSNIKQLLEETLDKLRKENIQIWLRPEVMGKRSQFGTIEEVIRLCSELEGLAPCIDFAHLHAATGANNSYQEFVSILQQLADGLGRTALDNMHIHCSGIKYGAKGEIKHLNLQESDLRYTELLKALKEYKVKGLLVCESPNLEEDALLLQETYHNLAEVN